MSSAHNIHKGLTPFCERERRTATTTKTTRVGKERDGRAGTQRGPTRRSDRVLGPEGIRNDEGTTSIEIRFRRRDSIVRTSPVDPTEDKGKRPIPGGCYKNGPALYGGTPRKPFPLPLIPSLFLFFADAYETSWLTKAFLAKFLLLFWVIRFFVGDTCGCVVVDLDS